MMKINEMKISDNTGAAYIYVLCAIYGILTNDFEDRNKKLAFLIGVIFLPVLGPIVYLNNRKALIKTKPTE